MISFGVAETFFRSYFVLILLLFSCGHATLYEALSVRWSVGPSVRRSVSTSRKVGKQAFQDILSRKQLQFRPCPPVRNWWPCIRPCLFLTHPNMVSSRVACPRLIKQGRIHGQYQLWTGGQERKCAFSHFSTCVHGRTDGRTNRPMDGQSLL